jgi:hypothetical protein
MTGANRAAYFGVTGLYVFILLSFPLDTFAQQETSVPNCKATCTTYMGCKTSDGFVSYGKPLNEGKSCKVGDAKGVCSKGECRLTKEDVKPIGADGKPIESATPSVNCTPGTAGCSNLSAPPSGDPPLSDGPLLNQPSTIDPTKAFEPPVGGTDPFDSEPKPSVIDRLKSWWTAPADSNAELPAGRTPFNSEDLRILGSPEDMYQDADGMFRYRDNGKLVSPEDYAKIPSQSSTFGDPSASGSLKPGLPELTDEFIQQSLGDGPPIIDRAAFEAKAKAYQEAQERLQRYVNEKQIPSVERTLPPDPNGTSAGKYTQYMARTRAEEQELNRLIGGVNTAGKEYNKVLADVEAASKYKPLALSSYAENYRSLYQQYDPSANVGIENTDLNKKIAQSYMLNRANLVRPVLQQQVNNSCNNADLTCDPKQLKQLENVDGYIKQLKSGDITSPELKITQAKFAKLLGERGNIAFMEMNQALKDGSSAVFMDGWNLLGTGPLNTTAGIYQMGAGVVGHLTGGLFGLVENGFIHGFEGSIDTAYQILLTNGLEAAQGFQTASLANEVANLVLLPGVFEGAGSLARAGGRLGGEAILGETLAGVGRGNFGFPGVVRELPPAQSLWGRITGQELGGYPGAYRQAEGFAVGEAGSLRTGAEPTLRSADPSFFETRAAGLPDNAAANSVDARLGQGLASDLRSAAAGARADAATSRQVAREAGANTQRLLADARARELMAERYEAAARKIEQGRTSDALQDIQAGRMFEKFEAPSTNATRALDALRAEAGAGAPRSNRIAFEQPGPAREGIVENLRRSNVSDVELREYAQSRGISQDVIDRILKERAAGTNISPSQAVQRAIQSKRAAGTISELGKTFGYRVADGVIRTWDNVTGSFTKGFGSPTAAARNVIQGLAVLPGAITPANAAINPAGTIGKAITRPAGEFAAPRTITIAPTESAFAVRPSPVRISSSEVAPALEQAARISGALPESNVPASIAARSDSAALNDIRAYGELRAQAAQDPQLVAAGRGLDDARAGLQRAGLSIPEETGLNPAFENAIVRANPTTGLREVVAYIEPEGFISVPRGSVLSEAEEQVITNYSRSLAELLNVEDNVIRRLSGTEPIYFGAALPAPSPFAVSAPAVSANPFTNASARLSAPTSVQLVSDAATSPFFLTIERGSVVLNQRFIPNLLSPSPFSLAIAPIVNQGVAVAPVIAQPGAQELNPSQVTPGQQASAPTVPANTAPPVTTARPVVDPFILNGITNPSIAQAPAQSPIQIPTRVVQAGFPIPQAVKNIASNIWNSIPSIITPSQAQPVQQGQAPEARPNLGSDQIVIDGANGKFQIGDRAVNIEDFANAIDRGGRSFFMVNNPRTFEINGKTIDLQKLGLNPSKPITIQLSSAYQGEAGAMQNGTIIINPKMLTQLSPGYQMISFLHELGHVQVGTDELAADAWATRVALANNLVDAGEWEGIFADWRKFEPISHTPAQPRIDQMNAIRAEFAAQNPAPGSLAPKLANPAESLKILGNLAYEFFLGSPAQSQPAQQTQQTSQSQPDAVSRQSPISFTTASIGIGNGLSRFVRDAGNIVLDAFDRISPPRITPPPARDVALGPENTPNVTMPYQAPEPAAEARGGTPQNPTIINPGTAGPASTELAGRGPLLANRPALIAERIANWWTGAPQQTSVNPWPEWMRKAIFYAVEPIGYKSSNTNISNLWTGLTTGEHALKNLLGPTLDKNRLDAWGTYLGLGQRYNTFSPAQFRPSKLTDTSGEYYKINNYLQNIMNSPQYKTFAQQAKITDPNDLSGAIKYLYSSIKPTQKQTLLLRDSANFIMGTYVLALGQDANGPYISYYDAWKLQSDDWRPGKTGAGSTEGTSGLFGTPFKIYDRFYYDPVTYALKTNVSPTNSAPDANLIASSDLNKVGPTGSLGVVAIRTVLGASNIPTTASSGILDSIGRAIASIFQRGNVAEAPSAPPAQVQRVPNVFALADPADVAALNKYLVKNPLGLVAGKLEAGQGDKVVQKVGVSANRWDTAKYGQYGEHIASVLKAAGDPLASYNAATQELTLSRGLRVQTVTGLERFARALRDQGITFGLQNAFRDEAAQRAASSDPKVVSDHMLGFAADADLRCASCGGQIDFEKRIMKAALEAEVQQIDMYGFGVRASSLGPQASTYAVHVGWSPFKNGGVESTGAFANTHRNGYLGAQVGQPGTLSGATARDTEAQVLWKNLNDASRLPEGGAPLYAAVQRQDGAQLASLLTPGAPTQVASTPTPAPTPAPMPTAMRASLGGPAAPAATSPKPTPQPTVVAPPTAAAPAAPVAPSNRAELIRRGLEAQDRVVNGVKDFFASLLTRSTPAPAPIPAPPGRVASTDGSIKPAEVPQAAKPRYPQDYAVKLVEPTAKERAALAKLERAAIAYGDDWTNAQIYDGSNGVAPSAVAKEMSDALLAVEYSSPRGIGYLQPYEPNLGKVFVRASGEVIGQLYGTGQFTKLTLGPGTSDKLVADKDAVDTVMAKSGTVVAQRAAPAPAAPAAPATPSSRAESIQRALEAQDRVINGVKDLFASFISRGAPPVVAQPAPIQTRLNVPAAPNGTQVRAVTTFYAPGAGGARSVEGPWATSKANLEGLTNAQGHPIPRTLDDVRLGKSSYVSLATHTSRNGQFFKLDPVTYRSPIDRQWYTGVKNIAEQGFVFGGTLVKPTYSENLANVIGYSHDWGRAFRYNTSKFDVAVGDFRGWRHSSAAAFVNYQPYGMNQLRTWQQISPPEARAYLAQVRNLNPSIAARSQQPAGIVAQAQTPPAQKAETPFAKASVAAGTAAKKVKQEVVDKGKEVAKQVVKPMGSTAARKPQPTMPDFLSSIGIRPTEITPNTDGTFALTFPDRSQGVIRLVSAGPASVKITTPRITIAELAKIAPEKAALFGRLNGNFDPRLMAGAANALEIATKEFGYTPRISSGNRMGAGGHGEGRALDFGWNQAVANTLKPEHRDRFHELMRQQGIDVYVEADRSASRGWTGPHTHVEVGMRMGLANTRFLKATGPQTTTMVSPQASRYALFDVKGVQVGEPFSFRGVQLPTTRVAIAPEATQAVKASVGGGVQSTESSRLSRLYNSTPLARLISGFFKPTAPAPAKLGSPAAPAVAKTLDQQISDAKAYEDKLVFDLKRLYNVDSIDKLPAQTYPGSKYGDVRREQYFQAQVKRIGLEMQKTQADIRAAATQRQRAALQTQLVAQQKNLSSITSSRQTTLDQYRRSYADELLLTKAKLTNIINTGNEQLTRRLGNDWRSINTNSDTIAAVDVQEINSQKFNEDLLSRVNKGTFALKAVPASGPTFSSIAGKLFGTVAPVPAAAPTSPKPVKAAQAPVPAVANSTNLQTRIVTAQNNFTTVHNLGIRINAASGQDKLSLAQQGVAATDTFIKAANSVIAAAPAEARPALQAQLDTVSQSKNTARRAINQISLMGMSALWRSGEVQRLSAVAQSAAQTGENAAKQFLSISNKTVADLNTAKKVATTKPQQAKIPGTMPAGTPSPSASAPTSIVDENAVTIAVGGGALGGGALALWKGASIWAAVKAGTQATVNALKAPFAGRTTSVPVAATPAAPMKTTSAPATPSASIPASGTTAPKPVAPAPTPASKPAMPAPTPTPGATAPTPARAPTPKPARAPLLATLRDVTGRAANSVLPGARVVRAATGGALARGVGALQARVGRATSGTASSFTAKPMLRINDRGQFEFITEPPRASIGPRPGLRELAQLCWKSWRNLGICAGIGVGIYLITPDLGAIDAGDPAATAAPAPPGTPEQAPGKPDATVRPGTPDPSGPTAGPVGGGNATDAGGSSPSSGGGGGGIGEALQSAMKVLQPILPQLMEKLFGPKQKEPEAPKVPSVKLTANPTSVDSGKTSRLSWTGENIASCTVLGPGDKKLTTGGANGAITTPELKRSTEFGIACSGSDGKSITSAVVTVKVNGDTQAPIPVIFPDGASASGTGSSVSSQLQQSLQNGQGTQGTQGTQAQTNQQTTQTQANVQTQTPPPQGGTSWCDPNLPIDAFTQCLCRLEPTGCRPWKTTP